MDYKITKIDSSNVDLILSTNHEAEFNKSNLMIKTDVETAFLTYRDTYVLTNRLSKSINDITNNLSNIVSNNVDINKFNFEIIISDNRLNISFIYDAINRKIKSNFVISNEHRSVSLIKEIAWIDLNFLVDNLKTILNNWIIIEQNNIIIHNITYNYTTNTKEDNILIDNTVEDKTPVIKENDEIKKEVNIVGDEMYESILSFKDENIEEEFAPTSNKDNQNIQFDNKSNPVKLNEDIFDMF